MREEQGESGVLRVFTSRKETRAFYNKISDYYDLLSEHSEGPIRAVGIAMLAPLANHQVLEIGCGTGHAVASLAAAVGSGGQVIAVDLSDRMLQRSLALVTAQQLQDRVHFVCGDGLHLPLCDASLDCVFMSFTLELFDTKEIPPVLEECRRVLKPGGRIAVVGMSKEGPGGIMVEAYEWSHQHFPNFVDCRPIFVSRSLEEAGFRVVQKTIEQMWLPVEVVLARK
jgi:ubiquinone/menaquinone biosynthesis C-methylase UbiE